MIVSIADGTDLLSLLPSVLMQRETSEVALGILQVCVCVCVHVCVCVCVCVYRCVCVCVCTCMCVCIIYMYMCVLVHVCLYTCVCVCVLTRVCVIGASVSKPHTSVTSLRRACVFMLACLLACLLGSCKYRKF